MPDWFETDSRLEDLFAQLRGQARIGAMEAVQGAADALVARLPSLGAAARAELAAAIQQVRVAVSAEIDAQQARAIRILAQYEPTLRDRVNRIARDAGASLSGGALEEADRQGGIYAAKARSWVIAGGAVAALLAVAVAVTLGQQARSQRRVERRVA